MGEPQFIQLVADYGPGDLAMGEVIQKLQGLCPGIIVFPTSIPSFNTIATGFCAMQYALVNPTENMIIYTNTAPRRDDTEKRNDNEGEKLMYALLKNGMKIVGVNAGHCFSFVKDEIKELHEVNVANKGSQFRSRDFFPEAVVGIAKGIQKFIGETVDIDSIPNVPKNRIAWIDSFGNIKTTLRQSDLKKFKVGTPVMIGLGTMKRTAWVSDGSFSVREGELAFSAGSSGGNDKFMELFLRGLSAWKELGKPTGEEELTVEEFEQ